MPVELQVPPHIVLVTHRNRLMSMHGLEKTRDAVHSQWTRKSRIDGA